MPARIESRKSDLRGYACLNCKAIPLRLGWAVDIPAFANRYYCQVGLEISGRCWAFGISMRPFAFQGNTFSRQPLVSPAGLRRNFFATMSYARFACMGRANGDKLS